MVGVVHWSPVHFALYCVHWDWYWYPSTIPIIKSSHSLMYLSTGSCTTDYGGWEQIWEHISGRGVGAARAPGNRSLNVKTKEPKCWVKLFSEWDDCYWLYCSHLRPKPDFSPLLFSFPFNPNEASIFWLLNVSTFWDYFDFKFNPKNMNFHFFVCTCISFINATFQTISF